MARNTFATIGILAVLLLSIGMISAAAVQNITLTLEDKGTSTDKISGDNGTVHSFAIELNHSNNTIGEIYVNWTGGTTFFTDVASISGTQNNGTVHSYTFEFTLPASGISTKTITAHIYNSTNLSQEFGTKTKTINYNVTSTTTTPTPNPTTNNTLCELEGFDKAGDLEISDFDINNNGDGNDEEWQYLDEIEIVVEVENTNDDDDVEDVEVKIVILDGKMENGGKDVTNDFDVEDEVLTDIGRLKKDGEQDTVTFIIPSVPADMNDGTYYVYVMAYEDGNETGQCISESSKLDKDFYFEFSIESVDYEDSVSARGTEIEAQIDTYCGQQNLEISFPVYNLGSDEEEKVLVNIFNSALGINQYEVIDDLDNGDEEIVTFFIDIPEELAQDKYDLDITVHFDWDTDEDEDDEVYYDEETSDSSIRLSVLSCNAPVPSINAVLDSDALVGEELIIKAIVTNNGIDNDFVISASDFESWAELVSVTPQTSSIKEGEFTEVIVKLIPTKSGTHSFNINTIVDGESHDQLISLSIEGTPGVFEGIDNTMLYTIAGIVAVLILIFLALIVRVSRRSAKPQF